MAKFPTETHEVSRSGNYADNISPTNGEKHRKSWTQKYQKDRGSVSYFPEVSDSSAENPSGKRSFLGSISTLGVY